MDGSEILLSIVTTFISKWVPMNFDGNSYFRVPMISGKGTEKLFTTRFENLGLALGRPGSIHGIFKCY